MSRRRRGPAGSARAKQALGLPGKQARAREPASRSKPQNAGCMSAHVVSECVAVRVCVWVGGAGGVGGRAGGRAAAWPPTMSIISPAGSGLLMRSGRRCSRAAPRLAMQPGSAASTTSSACMRVRPIQAAGRACASGCGLWHTVGLGRHVSASGTKQPGRAAKKAARGAGTSKRTVNHMHQLQQQQKRQRRHRSTRKHSPFR